MQVAQCSPTAMNSEKRQHLRVVQSGNVAVHLGPANYGVMANFLSTRAVVQPMVQVSRCAAGVVWVSLKHPIGEKLFAVNS